MPLVKSAAEINREISSMCPPTAPTPPPPPSSKPDRLGPMQYALLELIRSKPYWVVDRAFWRVMARKLRIPAWRVRKVFLSLERDGYILVSEREPRIVQATERRR